ncbi:acyltransferase [Burkholderia sp. MSMB1459WGS]|uniref:acyltransferase family protein n=1 Tax=unclassified Burkholderia TaxID=2613784 RepID=UPI000757769E|nr:MULTISPECIES: acyltransferase [unclassified Burkholderia]KVT05504.1 acyltransferase [Burkholderia sp. MSMB1078WGS]KWO45789.1 acyltransferase [Burkholderia sp. MSMB1459WGS]
MTMHSEPSGRLDHIDAMRAVAVLLVIWTHYAERFVALAGAQQWLDTLQRSVNFGRIGVVVFFGISGLLIPVSLHGPAGPGTRRFLIRRFLRLYPAFWLSIPIGCVVFWTLFGKPVSATLLIANATMIPTAFGQEPVMGHYWTLETELYFYGLCLVLFWWGGLHRMRDLSLACIGLCAVFVTTVALHVFPDDTLGQYKAMPYHLAIMFWGACFRQAYDRPLDTLRVRGGRGEHAGIALTYRCVAGLLTAMIVGVALVGAANDWRHHNVDHLPSSLAYVVGVAIFVAMATVLKVRARAMAKLGEVSYSIYLFHAIPLFGFYWLCEHYRWTGWPLGVYMIVPVVPLIALSYLSYRYCEAPCVRLAHRLTASRWRGGDLPVGNRSVDATPGPVRSGWRADG